MSGKEKNIKKQKKRKILEKAFEFFAGINKNEFRKNE